MAKIKLTVQELKHQQNDLKRYRRFLPTLVLKKLQIQIGLDRVKVVLGKKVTEEKALLDGLQTWIAVMGEEVGITEMVQVEAIEKDKGNVAGVEVPVFKRIRFKKMDYDLYAAPLWVDRAARALSRLLTLRAEILTMEEQIESLENELRTTIQRVNLFEKIKIPEALENIRVIRIYLGDQQTAAVVRGKMAKVKASQHITKAGPAEEGMP